MGSGKSKPASAEGGAAGATEATGSAKPSTSEKRASSSTKASGAYLVYSVESGGMLYLQWSDSTVSGALAFFSPRKTVPAHKKTQNAGRVELIRGIAANKHKMLEGVVVFVKEAAIWDSDVKSIDNQYFDIWYCQGGSVKGLSPGSTVGIGKTNALAVMPHGNTSFKGVQKIDVNNFVNTANREGAVWKR